MLILFRCDVGHFRKSVLTSCFLKKWQYNHYKFQTSFHVAFCCIANKNTLSYMHIRFIALNLGILRDFGKGTFFRHFVDTLCITAFRLFGIDVCLYSVYGKTFELFQRRNFGGNALMRSRNSGVFCNMVYVLVTSGHVIST